MDGKPEGPQKIFVAEEDESESASGAAAESEQHANSLEGRTWIVLSIVEDQDEGNGVEVGEMFSEDELVGAALEARAFAKFGQDDFEDAGAGKRGLSDEQG